MKILIFEYESLTLNLVTMNDFYYISENKKVPDNSLLLENLGDKKIWLISGTSSRNEWGGREYASNNTYIPVKDEDYDRLFARRLSKIKPPYEMEKFLDFHFQHYLRHFPGQQEKFQKHMKYVIVPILSKGKHDIYVELLNEWLEEKSHVQMITDLTENQKLDKILVFLATNPARNNITAKTVHQEIFEKSISFDDAMNLYMKVMVSGMVRVIGYQYLMYSLNTGQFLDRGGFTNQRINIPNAEPLNIPDWNVVNVAKSKATGEVFISYSWDNEEHENKVVSFTTYLRGKGFDARMDKMISQEQTATNFTTMMHKAMFEHQKIIIILSQGYKRKADSFSGGVGKEYELLLNDIEKNPKKYILVSFEGRALDLIPFGLQGRDIIDLSSEDNDEKLFRKLTGQDEYVFPEVAPEKPSFKPKKITDFRSPKPKE